MMPCIGPAPQTTKGIVSGDFLPLAFTSYLTSTIKKINNNNLS
jgi:hypothetical protein